MDPGGFSRIAELLPDALLLVDADGAVLGANRGAAERLRLAPRQLSSLRLTDCASHPHEFLRYLRACSRTRTLLPGSLSFLHPEGETISLRLEGAVAEPRSDDQPPKILLRLLARETASGKFLSLNQTIGDLAKEIRSRRRVEAELREQSEWLYVTLSSIGDGLIASDASGRVRFMNPAAEILTGWSNAEARDQPLDRVFRLVSETSREPVENPATVCLKAVWPVKLANDCILIDRSGTERPIDDSAAPIVDETGELLGSVLVFRDVSERRKAAAEIARAREAAESANRAKSNFLAMVSHELRTPMNTIIGMAELVLLDELPLELRDYVWTLRDAAGNLLELVNQLLDLSKMESGKLSLESTPFPLRRVVGDALRMLSVQARAKGLRLRWEVAETVPDELLGDPLRLRQILLNLVGNGIKFTREGEVHLAVVSRDGESDRVELEFTVSDTGIGIAPEKLATIFAPFAQVDSSTTREFSGTGLGLPIAGELVGLMGGRIWAESELGRGSRFHFTVVLPRATESTVSRDAGALGRASPSERPAARRSLRILLAEDTPANQKLVSAFLRRAGHEVDLAGNGEAVLSALDRRRYDAIVMDVQMPIMDGFQATAAIRAREKATGAARTPIVALSAHAMKGFRERCLAAGMDDYFAKPFAAGELLGRIEALAAELGPASRSPERHDSRLPAAEDRLVWLEQEIFLGTPPEEFLREFRRSLQEIGDATRRGNAEELERVAHSLRGVAALVGATELSEAAHRLELIARTKRWQDAPAALERLAEILHQLESRRESPNQAGRDPSSI